MATGRSVKFLIEVEVSRLLLFPKERYVDDSLSARASNVQPISLKVILSLSCIRISHSNKRITCRMPLLSRKQWSG